MAQVGATDIQKTIQQLSGVLSTCYHLIRAQDSRYIGAKRLSQYRFRHFLYHKFLYGNLDAIQRAYLHEATGLALETLYEQQPEELSAIAGELARHFKHARLTEKAIIYYRQAGDRAVRLSAHAKRPLSISTRHWRCWKQCRIRQTTPSKKSSCSWL